MSGAPVLRSAESLIPAKGVSEKLRILQIVTWVGTGGTELGVGKIITGLNPDVFDQRICATRGVDQSTANMICPGKDIFVAGEANNVRQLHLFRLVDIMRQFRPHIVHSRNWGAIESVLAARIAKVPIVIHSEHGYELDMLSGMPARRRLLRNAFYRMTDQLFTVTQELRFYHAQQGWTDASRISVLYNGVDTNRFAPRPSVREAVRRKLNIPPSSILIGCVSRLVPIKDHSTLLRAVSTLISTGVDARVLIVGSGSELTRLQLEADAEEKLRGRVIFCGSSQEIPEMLNAMDVFVLPSISEGMSNTILEAMAAGLPVVATMVGGNPEVIVEDVTGAMFKPGDDGRLAVLLQMLSMNSGLRAAFGDRARERALKYFSIETMLRNYENMYLNLAERKHLLNAERRLHVRN